MSITHSTVVVVPDDGTSPVGTDEWNASHTIAGTLAWDGATVTADTPLIDLSQTWNNAGVTFTGVKVNITATASAAASKLMDLKIGGTSQFQVLKTGEALVGDGSNVRLITWAGDGNRGIRAGSAGLELYNSSGVLFASSSAAGTGWVVDDSAFFGWRTETLKLFRDATAILAQRNDTAAQTFRVYNTYTDASNYERGVFSWTDTANTLTIGTQKAGTGTNRAINFMFSGLEAFGQYIQMYGDQNNLRLKASGTSASLVLESQAGLISVTSDQFYIGSTSAPGIGIVGANGGTTGAVGFGRVFNYNGSGDFQVNWNFTAHVDDKPAQGHKWICQAAYASASTNLVGGNFSIIGGAGASGSAGLASGGNIYLDGGQGFGTGMAGNIYIGNTRGNLIVKGRTIDTVVTLTDGATVALDSSVGNTFKLVAAGNRTISAPTNKPATGQGQKITIIHEASGADRTLALTTGSAGAFRFGTDITALTATTSGLRDYIGCYYNASDDRWDVIAYSKGY